MRPKSFYAGVLAIYQRITHDYLIFYRYLCHIFVIITSFFFVDWDSGSNDKLNRFPSEACMHTEKGRIAHT